MLIVLGLVVLLLGIGIMCINIPPDKIGKNKLWNFLWYLEKNSINEAVGAFIAVMGFICLVIMLLILPFTHLGKNATIAESEERYKALIYKVESGACRDEFGLLNKEVLDEVQDWNEVTVKNKKLQKDFWIGVFIPNIYDQFETIDYEKYGRE